MSNHSVVREHFSEVEAMEWLSHSSQSKNLPSCICVSVVIVLSSCNAWVWSDLPCDCLLHPVQGAVHVQLSSLV